MLRLQLVKIVYGFQPLSSNLKTLNKLIQVYIKFFFLNTQRNETHGLLVFDIEQWVDLSLERADNCTGSWVDVRVATNSNESSRMRVSIISKCLLNHLDIVICLTDLTLQVLGPSSLWIMPWLYCRPVITNSFNFKAFYGGG